MISFNELLATLQKAIVACSNHDCSYVQASSGIVNILV